MKALEPIKHFCGQQVFEFPNTASTCPQLHSSPVDTPAVKGFIFHPSPYPTLKGMVGRSLSDITLSEFPPFLLPPFLPFSLSSYGYLFLVAVVRILEIYSLSTFQVYNAVLLTRVIMLHIRYPAPNFIL